MQRDAAHEFPAEFYQAFASAGWLGITTPQEYGGNGCGITEASLQHLPGRRRTAGDLVPAPGALDRTVPADEPRGPGP
jgi:Acyl-CoA dehydrogenase, N-terminal domain